MSEEWETHAGCGGHFEQIGTVIIGLADVPNYRCDKCGAECDASESEMFEGYQRLRAANREGTE